jgi:RND family efflux transporter MFP subunit
MSETPSPTPELSRLRIRRDDPPAPGGGARRGVLWLVLLVVAALGTAGFFVLRPPPVAVEVANVSVSGGAGSVTGEGITANGYVVARTKASVSAKIAGQLTYLGVHEGSHVRAGEIVARIESDAYSAAAEAAKAEVGRIEVDLAQARRDLERARSLRDQQVVSTRDLEDAQTRVDAAQAQLNSARAQLKVAQANLENTNVRAPFDGTVLRKDAEVGEIVAPSAAGGGLTRTAIVTMADLATLEVEVDVNEAYIAQIRNGQDARVTLDAYPDTSFHARVRQIVPTADRQKATVLVKVSILDHDPRILPEMGAKVVFVREAQSASVAVARPRVLVPAEALVRDGTNTRVWLVRNGRLAARQVTLGHERGDAIEVEQGLDGGESVVLKPAPTLRDGLPVRVRPSSS